MCVRVIVLVILTNSPQGRINNLKLEMVMDIENKIVQACNALPVAFAPAEKSIDSLIEAINKWRAHVLSDTVELKNNSNKFEDDAKSLRIERDALHAQLETTKRELMATTISWENALAELQNGRESAPVPAMPMHAFALSDEDIEKAMHGKDLPMDYDELKQYAREIERAILAKAMPMPKQEPAQAAAIPEDIELLIAEVKKQFMWRMEDSECGGDEIIESWDRTEFSIKSRLSSASTKPE